MEESKREKISKKQGEILDRMFKDEFCQCDNPSRKRNDCCRNCGSEIKSTL